MITWNSKKYELIENVKEGYDEAPFLEKVTEYYEPFDYILGDWAYGKLRLKGFYESNHKACRKYNDIKHYKEYIENDCAYGCKYFILKKIEQ